jgi:hypothetical protein
MSIGTLGVEPVAHEVWGDALETDAGSPKSMTVTEKIEADTGEAAPVTVVMDTVTRKVEGDGVEMRSGSPEAVAAQANTPPCLVAARSSSGVTPGASRIRMRPRRRVQLTR